MLHFYNWTYYKEKLDTAIDRNILVFDGDAEPGEFTKRLICLMKTVFRQNKQTGSGNIDVIYVDLEDLERFLDDSYPQYYDRVRLFGVRLAPCDGEAMTEYFVKEKKCTLAATDKKLILALGTEEGLIGSY